MQINPSGWYHKPIISALNKSVLTAPYVTDNERQQLCYLSYVATDLVALVGIVCWVELHGKW